MPPRRPVLHPRTLLFAVTCLAAPAARAPAALHPGFQASTIASGLSQPAGLAFAPDGRLLVAEKTGHLRLVKDGALVATPFLDVADLVPSPARFDDDSERGLLGVAVDPGFPAMPFVYLYYSVCKVPGAGAACQVAKNRVARVTAGYQGDPDRADPTSQVVLLDDIDSDTGIHNAGWLGFGPLDGMLYVSVGDSGTGGVKAQDLGSLNGKVLRIGADGGVPSDNPFADDPAARPEVWALGFRNPWRCRFHPAGHLFCGDVGQEDAEEIDHVVEGGNYGWPLTEGDFPPTDGFVRPIHAYPHQGSGSISLGDFGSRTDFPGDHQQSFYFGDYSQQWIRRIVLGEDGVTVLSWTTFETPPSGGITDLVAGPDGALYCTDILSGTIRRIAATGANQPPVARASATPSAGSAPLNVQFSSAGSTDADDDPLTVRWNFGDGSPTSTAAAPSHTYAAPGAYTATLTVSDGWTPTPGTDTVTVPITVGTLPVVTITQPAADSSFQGGQTIALAGSAADAEDGPLSASALHWEIRFHHADHWHPHLNDLPGSPQAFDATATGHTETDVSYRIILRATDSSGLTGETSLYILPRLARLRLETSPSGLQITLDGQPRVTPLEVTSVVGVVRTIGAPSPQGPYSFGAWSDGGVQVHTITTQAADTTYTALFNAPTTTTTSVPPTTTTTVPPTSTTTTSTTSTTAPDTSTTSTTSPITSTTVTTTTEPPTTATSTTTSSSTSSTTATAPPTSTTATSSTTPPSSTTATSSSTSSSSLPSSSTSTSTPTTITTASSTTSTTVPPRCAPGLTPQDVGCRIDELAGMITAASSDLGRLAPGLERRLAHAVGRVQHAAALCEAGHQSRAQTVLRTAHRRVLTSLAKIRSRAGRRVIPPTVATELAQRLGAAAADLKALRDGPTCP